LKQVSFILLI